MCGGGGRKRNERRNGENQDDDEEAYDWTAAECFDWLQLQLLNGQGNMEVEMEVGVKNNWELGVDR